MRCSARFKIRRVRTCPNHFLSKNWSSRLWLSRLWLGGSLDEVIGKQEKRSKKPNPKLPLAATFDISFFEMIGHPTARVSLFTPKGPKRC
jgi:hypothetical protein